MASHPKRELELPELRYFRKHRIGIRFCLLAPARICEIEETTKLRISLRREIDRHRMASGEVIAVTKKRLAEVPAEATALLLHEPGRKPTWQWHSRLEDFKARFEADPVGVAAEIEASWRDGFRFKAEIADENGVVAEGHKGLRPPQIGALHAVGMHSSVFANEAATVVMPTGTGKTETMLCTAVNYREGSTLVAVPSNALRWQTARKFESLGLLRTLGLVDQEIHNPVVAVITKEANHSSDLDLIRGCNVVIGVMASLGGTETAPLFPEIAASVRGLFADQAHHAPSTTWSAFKAHFTNHRIVQFTATPFRLDGKLVDGRVVFSYPLAAAQRDGYFKPALSITALPVAFGAGAPAGCSWDPGCSWSSEWRTYPESSQAFLPRRSARYRAAAVNSGRQRPAPERLCLVLRCQRFPRMQSRTARPSSSHQSPFWRPHAPWDAKSE